MLLDLENAQKRTDSRPGNSQVVQSSTLTGHRRCRRQYRPCLVCRQDRDLD